jgi:ribosome-binding factor A
MSFKRADRVSEAIKREISLMVQQDVKDPRVHFVTVTDVQTTDDLRYAKIYVSILGDKETRKESLTGLVHAKGFLRSELGRRLGLRYTPDIQFFLDESLDHSIQIRTLLNTIKKDEPQGEAPEGDESEDKESEGDEPEEKKDE